MYGELTGPSKSTRADDHHHSYKKWNKGHVLSFIPPDGHFDLLRYEAVLVNAKSATAAQSKTYPLPLVFKPELKLEESGGKSCWVSSSLSIRLHEHFRQILPFVNITRDYKTHRKHCHLALPWRQRTPRVGYSQWR